MESFALIFLAIAIGYILKTVKFLPKDSATTLNQFAIYVSLPAIILLQVPKINFSMDMVIPIIIPWSVMIITVVITIIISRILSFSKEITGCLLLVSILTNSSFLGLPIINAYLGEDALPYIFVYDQLGTFIALATYGTFIASYYSSKESFNIKIMVLKVITFPPFLALIISLGLMGTSFPPIIEHILNSFAITIIPVVLVAVGIQLEFRLVKEDILPFSVSLGIKLILAPLIAFLICLIFGWNSLSATVSILEAGMAPMITAGAIASMAGLAPRLSSAIVGYGILISFPTSYIIMKLIS